MRPNHWPRIALLAATLTLPALAGCMEKLQSKDSTDQGPGSGATGGVSSGANTDPRRGSAATSPERTGPG